MSTQINIIKNTKLRKILHILSDGNLHTGVFLGETLGVTRSAIWKLIQQLKEEMGLEIESKTNQGYKLQSKIEFLDLQKIKAYLSSRYHPYLEKCLLVDEITSTNSYLLTQLQKHKEEVLICLAERQTAGRGRFNRPWVAPFGTNIYLSLLWHFQSDLTQLSGFSLAIAVILTRALKKYGVEQAIAIKWPNDLIWENKKFAGILIDLHGEVHHNCSAVIGIGLNLYLSAAIRKTIPSLVTDLIEITQTDPRRNELVGLLLEELFDGLVIFQAQGLKPFVKEFKMLDWTYKKMIKIVVGENIFYGVGRGIDEQGRFLLEDAPGKIQRFSCGEASLFEE